MLVILRALFDCEGVRRFCGWPGGHHGGTGRLRKWQKSIGQPIGEVILSGSYRMTSYICLFTRLVLTVQHVTRSSWYCYMGVVVQVGPEYPVVRCQEGPVDSINSWDTPCSSVHL